MKLNTLLRYLCENVEAPEGSPLGQYLFAPERKDTPHPKEPNTDLEDEIQWSLHNFYNGNGTEQASTETEAGVLSLFDMKEKGLYSKLLVSPSGRAYRFMKNISPERVSKLYLPGLSVEDITSNPGKAFYVPDVGIVEKPNAVSSISWGIESLSSWTIEPDLSAFVKFLHTIRDLCSIVLVADIQSNDFVMNPKQLSKSLSYDTSMPVEIIGAEQEVIARGPVNVVGAAVYYANPAGPGMVAGDKVQAELLRAIGPRR